MIYNYVGGQKDFKISSPFVLSSKFYPGGKDCWIKYTLFIKDSAKDLATDGSYPSITLADGDKDGKVSVRINYSDHTYRELFEGADPEFDIIAQGHEPKAVDSNPAPVYGQETAKITVKIKFHLCTVTKPAAA